jgi:hypothetical protein
MFPQLTGDYQSLYPGHRNCAVRGIQKLKQPHDGQDGRLPGPADRSSCCLYSACHCQCRPSSACSCAVIASSVAHLHASSGGNRGDLGRPLPPPAPAQRPAGCRLRQLRRRHRLRPHLRRPANIRDRDATAAARAPRSTRRRTPPAAVPNAAALMPMQDARPRLAVPRAADTATGGEVRAPDALQGAQTPKRHPAQTVRHLDLRSRK